MRCPRCVQIKPASEFYRGDSRCKTCNAERAKLRRQLHGDRLRREENARRKLPENRAKASATHQAWLLTNRGREWRMWNCAKRRAAVLGLEFSITREDVQIPERCPLLDIPIVMGKGKLQAASPSLDRKDSAKGYVKGNVWVINYRANAIKQNATVAELDQIASRLRAAFPIIPGLDEGDE